MKRNLLLLASVLVSIVSFAQWTKPATPKALPLEVGAERYLFNVDAEGFLVGANDWGTRASVSQTLGHKVYIENGTEAGSYYLANDVLAGWMAGQKGYMFLDAFDQVYIDNTIDGKKNNQYTFEAKGDNIYNIGLSPANQDFTNELMAYLGVIPEKKDTRLYFCDPASEAYKYDGCQIRWIFTSADEYARFAKEIVPYNAAVALGKLIDEAKALEGTDATVLAEAEKVYGNTQSTAEQLNAAADKLTVAIKNAKYNVASLTNPVEVLSLIGIATDFSDGPTGWTSTTGAQNKGADNGNNAKDYSVTGNHYENWNSSPFTPGKISATAKEIPAGVYHLNALAFSNTGADAYLYAGESRTLVNATQIDVEKAFDVYALATGNELEIGLDIPTKGPNWVGLDNVALYYLGNDKAAVDFLTESILKAQPNYDYLFESKEALAQASLIEAYNAARADLKSAEGDAYAAAYTAFVKAAAALEASVAAYAPYLEKYNEATEWVSTATADNDEMNLLTDYLYSDDQPAAGTFNGNGGALYIINNGQLDAAQIAAELAYLDKIYAAAMANNMKDGDDVTSLLVNPNFAEQGGWKAAQGINWPTGSKEFPVFDAWGRVCDVYQELTGLQNGLYEMNLQAVYSAEEDIRQTYAYINDFDTKIGCATAEDPVNSPELASAAFLAGKYPVKVYGLVTDGKMRIGIANRLRTNENAGLYAGGVTLTFRAKNQEALVSMIEKLTPEAEALKDSKCGVIELDDLNGAINDANNAEGAVELYDALVTLKAAMDAVKEGVTLYQNLEVALFNLDQTIINAPANADKATLEAAKKYFDEINAAYGTKSLDNEEAQAAIEQLNTYTVAIKMGQSIASEDNPVDYSSAIVNNNFDPTMGNKDEKRIDGWVVSGALNGYKKYTASFNKGTFDLHQDLVGLPAGKYKVTVHTFYRAGSYEEEEANINAGKDTHLMKLYAGSEETSVMNLSEGAKGVTLPDGINTKTINGITVPDGTDASVACFNAGLYLNELTFMVGEDGKSTIGLKLDETIGSNDYTVIGEWNLWYMGNPNAGKTEQDVTSLIVNNNFDPTMGNKDEKRIDGWTVEGALNGYKKYTASFNKGTFKLSQELVGLPAGDYKVTVHTFYRAGSYEEEEANINAGKDTHLCKLFAGSEEKPVVNLSEGAKAITTMPEGINTKTINGITVPDGTDASVACFNAGYYLNELNFKVGEDGKAVIGLKLDETIGTNDYVVVGAWNLYYYGNNAEQNDDVSSLIVNNTFDPTMGNKDEKRIDGWVVSGALNGYKKYTASFNKGTFDLHQDLVGLPKGKYTVTVHTFYRAGSYEEEEANINAGKDTHLCKLYAGDQVKSVVNLSEGAKEITTMPEGINTKTINGITVPDGTDASVACFNAGYYLNTLDFTVGEDGKATIGLKLDETIGTNDYVVCGAWNLYYHGAAGSQELNEQDVTTLIVNNTFDPTMGNKDEKRIDGWNVEGALNGYKKYTASFNKGTFHLSQKLVGLPEGTYKVTVHTFYRAGSYEEEEAAINAGKDTHLCKLYAQAEETYAKPVVNLSEGAVGITIPEGVNTKTINGITVPDGTDASVACFNAGYYLNELPFYVGKNGEVTIGLRLDETIGTNDYVVCGAWNLYYYGAGNNVDKIGGGEATAIECIEQPAVEAVPVAFYNLNGVRLSQPQRGINIIKMSDGRAIKVMMK